MHTHYQLGKPEFVWIWGAAHDGQARVRQLSEPVLQQYGRLKECSCNIDLNVSMLAMIVEVQM